MDRLAARAILVLAMAWLIGLAWFGFAIPDAVEDAESKTDAIVVLTGGKGRIEEGVALLRKGLAKKLLVSGVEKGVDLGTLLKRAHLDPAPEDAQIVLGHDADSTESNAVETAAWMHVEGFHSLRLVTANYHMRRALAELRHALPDTRIVPNPVQPETFEAGHWWTRPGTLHLIAEEYTKYLLTLAEQALGLEAPPAPAKAGA